MLKMCTRYSKTESTGAPACRVGGVPTGWAQTTAPRNARRESFQPGAEGFGNWDVLLVNTSLCRRVRNTSMYVSSEFVLVLVLVLVLVGGWVFQGSSQPATN